jgi:hypothetical protein
MRKRTANRLIRAAMEAIKEIRGEQKPVLVKPSVDEESRSNDHPVLPGRPG